MQKRFVDKYVAITGSCGKTTTTALAGEFLGEYGSAVTGRDNAGVGLVRPMRKLRGPVDFLVQETAGHRPGAIDFTTNSLRIDVAVITSIGFDHASRFRFPDMDVRDAIAREKGKLVEAVVPGGFACLNFDDLRARAMGERTAQKVVGFGLAADADVRAENVTARWPGRLQFDLIVDGKRYSVSTRFVGTLMLTNVLGALAVVHGFGLPLEPAIAKLASLEPVRDRMGVHQGKDGKTYILDTEKAPYWSTEMLIEDLPSAGINDLTFVLGDVSDIRGNSSKDYRKLIRLVSPRVQRVVVSGLAAQYGARVAAEGFDNIVVADTAIDIARYLDGQPPCVVLIKSNRSSQLWRVLDQVTPTENHLNAT